MEPDQGLGIQKTVPSPTERTCAAERLDAALAACRFLGESTACPAAEAIVAAASPVAVLLLGPEAAGKTEEVIDLARRSSSPLACVDLRDGLIHQQHAAELVRASLVNTLSSRPEPGFNPPIVLIQSADRLSGAGELSSAARALLDETYFMVARRPVLQAAEPDGRPLDIDTRSALFVVEGRGEVPYDPAAGYRFEMLGAWALAVGAPTGVFTHVIPLDPIPAAEVREFLTRDDPRAPLRRLTVALAALGYTVRFTDEAVDALEGLVVSAGAYPGQCARLLASRVIPVVQRLAVKGESFDVGPSVFWLS